MKYKRSTFSFQFTMFILSAFVVSAFSQSTLNGITLKCKYEIITFGSRDYYTCIAIELENFQNDEEFTNLEGEHLEGKDTNDVTSFVIENQNVNFLPNKISDIFENLERLEVKKSSLIKVQKTHFEDLNLKVLKLENNLIEIIPEDAFENLGNLEELYLTDNKIEMLPQNVLKNLENLRVFSAEDNQIRELPEGLFENNKKLEIVNFFNNTLTIIAPNIFFGLDILKHSNLSENPCLIGIEETISGVSYQYETVYQIFAQFCSNLSQTTLSSITMDPEVYGKASTTENDTDYDENVDSSPSVMNITDNVVTTEIYLETLATENQAENFESSTELPLTTTDLVTTATTLAETNEDGSNSTSDDEVHSKTNENIAFSDQTSTTTSKFEDNFYNSTDSVDAVLPKSPSNFPSQNEEFDRILKFFEQKFEILNEKINKYEKSLENGKPIDRSRNMVDFQNGTNSNFDEPSNLENSTISDDDSLRNQTESYENKLSGSDNERFDLTKNETIDHLETTTVIVEENSTLIESSTKSDDHEVSTTVNSIEIGSTTSVESLTESENKKSKENSSKAQEESDSEITSTYSQDDLTKQEIDSTTNQSELDIEDSSIKPTDITTSQTTENSNDETICKSDEEYQKVIDEKDAIIKDLSKQIEELQSLQQHDVMKFEQNTSLAATSLGPSNQIESSTLTEDQLDNQMGVLVEKINNMPRTIKECKPLNESLDICQMEKEQIKQEQYKMQQIMQNLTVCKLEHEVARSNINLANLEIRMKQNDIDDYKYEKNTLESQIQELRSIVNSLEQTNSELMLVKQQLYQEFKDVSSDFAFLNTSYQQQKIKNQELVKQIAETNQKVSHFESISKTTDENMKLQTHKLIKCEQSKHYLLTLQINCQIENIEGEWTCVAKDVIAIHRYMEISVGSMNVNVQNLQIVESIFKYFTNYIFHEFRSLTSMEIINSKFSDLSEPKIENDLLRKLKIIGNSINEIPDSAFIGLPRLETLILTNNGITTVQPYAFNGLYNLKILDLKGNNIKLVDSYVFYGLKSLTHLSMSENQIKTLSRNLLEDQVHLEVIKFDKNPLSYIGNGLLDNANDLNKADFAGTCVGANTYPGIEEIKLRISLYCQNRY